MRRIFFSAVSNFLPISLEFAEFAISYLPSLKRDFFLPTPMDIIIIIHAFDRAATSAQAHARTLALSLSLPIYLSLVYLLACLRACKACASYEHGGGGGVQREEVIISAAILKAHAWRLFPWKSSPCLPLHLSFMEEGSRPIVRKHELF